MALNLFVKGLAIGLAIAAPVGAIGVLCISRTLRQGYLAGFVSGLGAATADGIYGCIAGFGLTFIADFLRDRLVWLHLIGGLFLCYLGLKTFLSRPHYLTIFSTSNSLIGAYLSTFFLTIINPMTILSFTVIFASAGLTKATNNYSSALITVLGVFLGSVLWWIILSSCVSLFRTKLDSTKLQLLNRISGIVIIIFGLLTFKQLR
ncbi:MAG: LysE family transporter [Hydrococcus sp. RU_2_2]|nr:LysE family transporter [Hydrococcus sp. RU_2_2]NJP20264.1 LysE family transporter [Hydrococcus sp. CRU_1_1]NJQ96745.1 LysE family transporter [Hydrococcus sp. CSU_1_8]